MQSGYLDKISKKLSLLTYFVKIKVNIHTYTFNILYPVVRQHKASLPQKVTIKEFNPTYVLIRKIRFDFDVLIKHLKIECQAVFNKNIKIFKFNLPNVLNIPIEFIQNKWNNQNLHIIISNRTYPLGLATAVKSYAKKEIMLKEKITVNKIDKNNIKLNRKLRITEEIVNISPYTRELNKDKLYKIPIIKKPLYKGLFLESQLSQFREILAKANNTKKSNIEILLIYDKFNMDIYSQVKQDAETRNLICYCKEKDFELTPDNCFFLIIGSRIDNKSVVKALAQLDRK